MVARIFLSRAGPDNGYATSLTKALGANDVLSQDHSVVTGEEFQRFMHEALLESDVTVALLSESYAASRWCLDETFGAQREERRAKRARPHRLIPLVIEEGFEPGGLLAAGVYLDVAGHSCDIVARLVREIIATGKPIADAQPALNYLRLCDFITNARFDDDTVFVGREGALTAIDGALWREGAAAITQAASVHGQGGVGKTALAKAYARENRHRYRGVWEVRAEERATLTTDLAGLAARLDDRHANTQDLEAAGKAALDLVAARAGRPFLFVFDNAADPELLRDWRPTAGAHGLITSRWNDWTGSGARAMPLDVLARDKGAELLRELAGRGAPEEATALSTLLGHLPLALTHAGAVLRRNVLLSFADYARDVERRIADLPRAMEYDRSVRAVLESNLANVAGDDPDAPALLDIAAVVAPDAIPLELWDTDPALASLPLALRDPVLRAEAFGALATWSVVTIDAPNRTLSLHRLTQAVVRARQAEVGEQDERREVALDALNTLFPFDSDEVRTWPICGRLAAHAVAVLGPSSPLATKAATRLANQCGLYFHGRAEYADAESMMRIAVALDEQIYGADHPDLATDLNNLAALLLDTNRFAEAEPLMHRIVHIFEKVEKDTGRMHPNYAGALSNLGSVLQAANRLEEAEPLIRRALAIGEATVGPAHLDVAIRLNNLAQLLGATDRLDEAEPLMRRVIGLFEKALGEDHPKVATGLNNLGLLLRSTDRLDEAEPLMRRALIIDEDSYGADHPAVAIDLCNLAGVLRDAQKLAEAEPLAARAVAICEASLGLDHPTTQAAQHVFTAIRADRRG